MWEGCRLSAGTRFLRTQPEDRSSLLCCLYCQRQTWWRQTNDFLQRERENTAKVTSWNCRHIFLVPWHLYPPSLTFFLQGTDAFESIPESDSQAIVWPEAKPFLRHLQHGWIQFHDFNGDIGHEVSQKLSQASSTKSHQEHRHWDTWVRVRQRRDSSATLIS